MDYWYDGQLRRYWMQFCRIFQGFSYESGVGANGSKTLRSVPVKLSSKNRQIHHILRNGSENTALSTPQITCEQIGMTISAERRQNPSHVSSVPVWEREIVDGKYTSDPGRTYTVERYMAVPYDIVMRMDLWTSNELQKHQLMEQILVLFNPSIDLQTGNNPVDWTSLTSVEIQDITWTNREMPVGTDDDIEVSSITFKMPIWLSPPAKIKRQNIIHQIITNIGKMSDDPEYKDGQANGYAFSGTDMYSRQIITPGDHQVRVEVIDTPNGKQFQVTLLGAKGSEIDASGKPWSWATLLGQYEQFRPGISQFRLKTNDDMDDHSRDIVGVFGLDPQSTNKLWWQPDPMTLPANDLADINGLVDVMDAKGEELARWPGDGVMPVAQQGQRYLLASDLPASPYWTNVVAKTNDIIQFDGQQWGVVFHSGGTTDTKVLLNRRSGKQLRWTGELWMDAVSGDYHAGFWRVFI